MLSPAYSGADSQQLTRVFLAYEDGSFKNKSKVENPVRRRQREGEKARLKVMMSSSENMMKSIIIESDKKEDRIRHNTDQETMEKNHKEQAKLRLMRTLVQRHDTSSKVCLLLFNSFTAI
ncbi:hypothetical protein QYF36_007674 [Acer negundo]|nr:hypothetical protein QYF36_007674 [Acer negundo]